MSEEDALAARVAEAMFERDRASKLMGMEIVEVRRGFARLALVVREEMLNGHDVCHGGYIFTLADSAFAYACNSGNHSTVALQCSISFSTSARLGDRLIATSQERVLGGRTGTYDGEVRREDGSTVALFRGTSYRLKGHIV
jgi:acyl-CoA thioesterase